MDLSGRTCIITGATTGLGLAVAKRFAAMGAETVLGCRDHKKGEKAKLEIEKEIPNASVEYMLCDLASLKSVKNFIDEFKRRHAKLDILYNNAAVMKQKRTMTEDGFEMMFQVNFLGAYILMNSFRDLLKNGSHPLIINNGRPSDNLRLNMEDLQFENKYSMYKCFFITKLYLLFTTLELSRRLKEEGIAVTMIDPGPFKSKLVRDMPLVGFIKNLFSAPVEKAADNLIYHIAPSDASDKNGKIFKEKKEYALTDYWKDSHISSQLWETTEFLLKDKINVGL